MGLRTKRSRGERGFVLVLALLFLVLLTLIGVSSINTTTVDNMISGNQRISKQAFYVAEAGINEFTGRFRPEATGEITDNNPSSTEWRLFLSRKTERARGIGYTSGNLNHFLIGSLENELDYGVMIEHKVENNKVVTWAGYPVYRATSYGFTSEGGNKVIEVEIRKVPDVDPPAPLYSKSPVKIMGSSSQISGLDKCPIDGVSQDKPGIITTTPTITESGSPTIDGSPEAQVTSSLLNLPLKEMVDYFKDNADFTYDYSVDQTLPGYSDDWGVPKSNGAQVPLAYAGQMNVVYFDMHGDKELTLSGGSHGAGLLLVDGDLELHGGFSWYGVIIVTGTFSSAGGGEKNITGGVLVGGESSVDVGGDATILYCSEGVKRLRDKLKFAPLKVVQWKEIF